MACKWGEFPVATKLTGSFAPPTLYSRTQTAKAALWASELTSGKRVPNKQGNPRLLLLFNLAPPLLCRNVCSKRLESHSRCQYKWDTHLGRRIRWQASGVGMAWLASRADSASKSTQADVRAWELAADHRLIWFLICDSPHREIKGREKNPQPPRLLS